MNADAIAQANFANLSVNSYPGRGIVLGELAEAWVQVYWIMGRSENSRNRIFELNADSTVRTKAFDESKLTDPSLIIYYPARSLPFAHIVTNGDQTDTIYQAMQAGSTFEAALFTREYEPDAPNFTPRISGVTYNDGRQSLAILKSHANSPAQGCLRQFFHYPSLQIGTGRLLTTYQGDGNPIPSFAGEPQLVPLASSAEAIMEQYWNALDASNRVSLLVRLIDKKSFAPTTLVKNKLG